MLTPVETDVRALVSQHGVYPVLDAFVSFYGMPSLLKHMADGLESDADIFVWKRTTQHLLNEAINAYMRPGCTPHVHER